MISHSREAGMAESPHSVEEITEYLTNTYSCQSVEIISTSDNSIDMSIPSVSVNMTAFTGDMVDRFNAVVTSTPTPGVYRVITGNTLVPSPNKDKQQTTHTKKNTCMIVALVTGTIFVLSSAVFLITNWKLVRQSMSQDL